MYIQALHFQTLHHLKGKFSTSEANFRTPTCIQAHTHTVYMYTYIYMVHVQNNHTVGTCPYVWIVYVVTCTICVKCIKCAFLASAHLQAAPTRFQVFKFNIEI